MIRSRLTNLLVAVAVGVLFVAGLATHGVLAAGLLLLVAALLVTLSAATWPNLAPRGRTLRVCVLAVVLAIAVLKAG